MMARYYDDDPKLVVQGEQLALYSPYNEAFKDALKELIPYTSVSYTHLTLPTILLV